MFFPTKSFKSSRKKTHIKRRLQARDLPEAPPAVLTTPAPVELAANHSGRSFTPGASAWKLALASFS